MEKRKKERREGNGVGREEWRGRESGKEEQKEGNREINFKNEKYDW